MLKQVIEYTDYNDQPQKATVFFNLTQAELTKWEIENSRLADDGVSAEGGLTEVLNKVVASRSGRQIIELFESIVGRAYGVKSEDGVRFQKSPELFREFQETAVYDAFFVQLVTDADYAQKFVRGIMPKKLSSDQPEAGRPYATEVVAENPLPIRTPGAALSAVQDAPKDISELSDEEIRKIMQDRGIV